MSNSIRKVLEDHKMDLKIETIRNSDGKVVGYYMFCTCGNFKWIPDRDSTDDPFLDHLAQVLKEEAV